MNFTVGEKELFRGRECSFDPNRAPEKGADFAGSSRKTSLFFAPFLL